MVTPRERARQGTLAEIRALAWKHLESEGAAGLSLRAIARDLGVVSSAIYRYVPSRDDLLTDLIVDGYLDLAEHAERAEAALVSSSDAPTARKRWIVVARAMRAWAVARPAAWALLFGSPVPGYDAPAERTSTAGTRTVGQMARIVVDAVGVGEGVHPAVGASDVPPSLLAGLRGAARSIGVSGADESHIVAATVLGWNSVLAAITSEVFEQLGPTHFGDAEAWADLAFTVSADMVGLPRDPAPA